VSGTGADSSQSQYDPVLRATEDEWLEQDVMYGFRMWHVLFLSAAGVLAIGKHPKKARISYAALSYCFIVRI
jgi:hypothetical protein